MIGSRSEIRGCAFGGREILSLYLDGELSEARRARIAAHLEGCERCAAALARLAEEDRRIAAACPATPLLSPAVSRALLERALAEAGARRGAGRGLGLLAWGLAALLIALGSGAAARWHHPLEIAHVGSNLNPLAGGVWSSADSAAPPSEALASHSPGHNGSARPGGERPLRSKLPRKPAHPTAQASPAKAPPQAPHVEDRPRHAVSLRHRLLAANRVRGDQFSKFIKLHAHSPRVRDEKSEHSDLLAGLPVPDVPTGGPDRPAFDPQACDAMARQVVAAARQGDPEAQERVVEALLPDDPPAPVPAPLDAALSGAGPGLAAMSTGSDLMAQSLLETQAAASEPPPAPPIAQLLVLATETPAPAPVIVSEAPDDTPGYARAIGIRPDPDGGLIWTQATATHEKHDTRLALVMLDDNPWDW